MQQLDTMLGLLLLLLATTPSTVAVAAARTLVIPLHWAQPEGRLVFNLSVARYRRGRALCTDCSHTQYILAHTPRWFVCCLFVLYGKSRMKIIYRQGCV